MLVRNKQRRVLSGLEEFKPDAIEIARRAEERIKPKPTHTITHEEWRKEARRKIEESQNRKELIKLYQQYGLTPPHQK